MACAQFVDTTFFNALIRLQHTLLRRHSFSPLMVVSVPAPIRRLFDILELSERMRVKETPAPPLPPDCSKHTCLTIGAGRPLLRSVAS